MNFLFWIYLWQRMEYRLDRMQVYLASLSDTSVILSYFLGQYRRPQWTKKAILLVATTLIIDSIVIWGVAFTMLSPYAFAILFIQPIIVAILVALISVPTRGFVTYTVMKARSKIEKLSNKIVVVGVTGSYGKTTTKEAIASVLSAKYNVLKTPGGVNTKYAIAKQILTELSEAVEVYVVEMGAYKQGEIRELVELVSPNYGVITGINEQHLALFGGIENTVRAKFELIDGLPQDGVAFLNTSNEHVEHEKHNASCELIEYRSMIPAENINVAIAIAEYLKLTKLEIDSGLQQIAQLPKRGERSELVLNGLQVVLIDNSYSSNPTGFSQAINQLANEPVSRRVVVTTGMYELGEQSQHIHAELEDDIRKHKIELILCDKINQNVLPTARVFENVNEIMNVLIGSNKSTLGVLVEGRNRITTTLINEIIDCADD